MSKVRSGNYFEDFVIGATFRHAAPRTLTDGDRSLYIGLTGSRAVLGTAVTNSRYLGLSGWPLDDILVFNVAFGKTVNDVSFKARGNLGYADVRFLAHVFAGDTLTVESTVIGLRENSSGSTGIVYVRSVARNQHEVEVLSYVRWVMVSKRDPKTPCPIAVVPTLPESVATEHLASKTFAPSTTAKAFAPGIRKIANLTGQSALWENYDIGERNDHPVGMTVHPSDAATATRLYQNNAPGHFDHILMSNRPLIYGGHIISLSVAAAYDGFENGIGILGINAGTHVAPTFAGDTICCASMVTDKIDISHDVGALRIRTVAAKNLAQSSDILFPSIGAGRSEYADNIVLDMDYTIAMPKGA